MRLDSRPNKGWTHNRLAYTALFIIILFIVNSRITFAEPLFAEPQFAEHVEQRQFRFTEIIQDEFDQADNQLGLITSIVQDHQGFMWFGGESGLARYDGINFRYYTSKDGDPHAISHTNIRDMLVDHEGTLWVATRRGLNRYDIENDTFVLFNNFGAHLEKLQTEIHQHIDSYALYEDNNRNLYLGYANGVIGFNATKTEARLYQPETPDHAGIVYGLGETPQGDILISVSGSGIKKLNHDTLTFDEPEIVKQNKAIFQRGIFRLAYGKDGEVWLASVNGSLHKLDSDGQAQLVVGKTDLPSAFSPDTVWDTLIDSQNNFWAASDNNGLLFIGHGSDTLTRILPDMYDKDALQTNQPRVLYEDRQGDIWIGTYDSKIYLYNQNKQKFKNFSSKPHENSLSDSRVLAFEESNEFIWIATENGLNAYQKNTGTFTSYSRQETGTKSTSNAFASLLYDKGELYIGSVRNGILIFDPQTHMFSSYSSRLPPPFSTTGFVWDLLFDSNGSLWAGTIRDGLWHYDPATQKGYAYRYEENITNTPPSNFISQLIEGKEHQLWLGTLDGLSVLDTQHKTFTHIRVGNTKTDTNLRVSTLLKTSDDEIWAGFVNDGIHIYSLEGESITALNVDLGLPTSYIAGLIEDSSKNIWASTNNGIFKIRKDKGYSITQHQKHHGIISNNYTKTAVFKDRQGNLYFGSSDGFTTFHPDKLGTPSLPSTIALTKLIVNGEDILLNRGGSDIIRRNIGVANELVLDHTHTSFSLEYALLAFRAPQYNTYEYQLEGFDKGWKSAGRKTNANYTNIPAGNYTFKVRGFDSEGIPSQKTAAIKVSISPAPWRTSFAYTVYAVLVFAFVGLIFVFLRKKVELQNEKSLNQELVKVANLKNAFLANTSHELRTPLNGIIGISEYLIDHTLETGNEHIHKHVKNIAASGKRLSNLISDILDFSKLENNTLNLQQEPVNVLQLTSEVFSILSIAQKEKDVKIINQLQPQSPMVSADPRRLQQILLNLIGNAIKYTDKGTITLSNEVAGNMMFITITDTGAGIAEKDLKNIFDLFNQTMIEYGQEKGGIGLGLAMTKELIDLHGGTIQVDSQVGVGSTFTFSLPLAVRAPEQAPRQAIEREPQITAVHFPIQPDDTVSARQKILVVDDDTVNRMVMRGILSKEYDVIEAEDGQEAVDIVQQVQHIDLIVLDIMMPNMNGFDACARIRETHSHDNLPIIFVTARNLDEDLAKGFEVGGNDFIEKPVSKHKLLPRVSNLIQCQTSPQ